MRWPASGSRCCAVRSCSSRRSAQAKNVLQVVPLETGLSDVRARFARPLTLLLGMGTLLLLDRVRERRHAARRARVVPAIRDRDQGRDRRRQGTPAPPVRNRKPGAGRRRRRGRRGVGVVVDAGRCFGLMPQGSTPILFDLSMDRRALAFCAAVSLVTALWPASLPALARRRFRSGRRAARSIAWRTGGAGRARPFAVIQVALSVVLVVASTMFATTLYTLDHDRPRLQAGRT